MVEFRVGRFVPHPRSRPVGRRLLLPRIVRRIHVVDPPGADPLRLGDRHFARPYGVAGKLIRASVGPPILLGLFLAISSQGGARASAGSDQKIQAEQGSDQDALPREPGTTPDWWGHVQRGIEESEYYITWQGEVSANAPAGWQAPNRAQGFRTYFTTEGINIVPRVDEGIAWNLGLSIMGYGRAGDIRPIASAALSPFQNQIDYSRSGIVERYVNDHAGLQQRITVNSPPEDLAQRFNVPKESAPLTLMLALKGNPFPTLSSDGQMIYLAAAGGSGMLRYGPLKAKDAKGRSLEARFEMFSEAGTQGISILVDDRGAAFPIGIESLFTGPAWTAESNQASARLGVSVATAGDVNGDGYSDVIVGAYLYDGGQTDEGRSFVYYGSAAGLSTSPSWTAESNQASARFGISVATAGDVNGDGYSDVIVGAYLYDGGQTDEGRAFVYYGSAAGLSASPSWTAESDQASADFGYSVASAGDVNGDSYSDVIIGAYLFDNGQTNEGKAFVYQGSAGGLSASPSWTAESNQASADFGYSVATAGDVNGDAYSEVVIGAYLYDNGQTDEGGAFIYYGSASGLASTPSWMAEADQASADFGYSVASSGDVNGDGYSDVIVGAYLYDSGQTDEGKAFAYYGSASGLASSPSWTAESNQASARLGGAIATAGDVNGDGYSDVIVGAYLYDNGQTDEGRTFVYHGSAAGLSASPSWTAESDQASADFGYSVAPAGDVNGDGYSDVIVGAYLYNNGQTDEGRVYVYLGKADAPSTTSNWMASGGSQGEFEFGKSVASAGDVNGDGYADVIVGDSCFDNNGFDCAGGAWIFYGSASGLSQSAGWTAGGDRASANLGNSVSSAGDVNGDGYDDVIIGAYEGTMAVSTGRVYVYYGSPSGPSTEADWIADSDLVGTGFGGVVGTAGDVNGDGYADVIIGNRVCYGSSPNRVYVYHGSASGLVSSPSWTAETTNCTGFGYSVATAGDVNADGYDDVIIGALVDDHGQNDEGRAFVYHGSPSGLSGAPNWAAEGDQIDANFGISVSSARDVNGDGYADVLVGARFYDSGQGQVGRAFVFNGSSSGLSTVANWSTSPGAGVYDFGVSVSTAGDVNGDGYADVIVGADGLRFGTPVQPGQAFAYFGSASGPSLMPNWSGASTIPGTHFGQSVASAGDVNGDGYADLVIGEPREFLSAQNGRAQVYYGNGGAGIALRPQQRRKDDTGPVSANGMTDSTDGFRLSLLGRTPFGRGLVRLEKEVKPAGAPFNGAGTMISPSWVDTGIGGSIFNELVGGLSDSTQYHWRIRLQYDSVSNPFLGNGRWIAVPWNGWQEADLRTPTILSAGSVPDGSVQPEQGLNVALQPNGDLTLSWGPSCAASDTDYEIYEGTLGNPASHTPRSCTTGGVTTVTLTPASGNKYYLVVPRNALREGSYGIRSDGFERPQGAGACLEQAVGTCQ